VTSEVEEYFSRFSDPQRTALTGAFNDFLSLLPGGEVVITYGLPTIRVGGSHLISVGGFATHNSIFPGPDAIARVGSALSGYALGKGTVQLGRDSALPRSVVKKFVVATIASPGTPRRMAPSSRSTTTGTPSNRVSIETAICTASGAGGDATVH